MVMSSNDCGEWVHKAFRILVQRGIVEVKMEDGREQFRFTSEGLAQTKKMIENDENAQLLMFTLHFNMLSQKEGEKTASQNKHVALKKTLAFMEQFNPDFLDVLTLAVKEGKIGGLKLKGE